MAFGMKAWLGLTAVLLLLVGIWGVSPPPRLLAKRTVLPERQEYEELEREITKDTWSYQRIFRRDTLRSELFARAADGSNMIVGLPIETPDSSWARVDSAIRLQLSNLELEEPVVPIGIFFIPASSGEHPDFGHFSSELDGRNEVYLAREGEAPYCIKSVPYEDRPNPRVAGSYGDLLSRRIASEVKYNMEVPANPGERVNTLGLCRYFARYGQPGNGILSWMKEGASTLAEHVLTVNALTYYDQGPLRGPFGKIQVRSWGFSPRTFRCLDGVREDCLGMVTDIRSIPRYDFRTRINPNHLLAESPVDFISRNQVFESEMLGLDPFLVDAMEEDFGPEQFGAFWRSEADPASAFEEAFGEPMDLWVMDWLRRRFDPSPRGPGVPVQSTLFTLLALGILAGGAVRMGRR